MVINTKTKHPDWKDFERLVAAIEKRAAPRNATVKSPDRIRDILTDRLREVDASIRFAVGSATILITIECRLRSRVADDTWIEQLATKREKLGAAKTIAVSATGFTQPAILTAAQHGIELRKLETIQPEDIDSWFMPHLVTYTMLSVDDIAIQVKVRDGRAMSLEPTENCLFHSLIEGVFPPAIFVELFKMRFPEQFDAIPKDGTQRRLEYSMAGTSPELVPVPLGVSKPKTTQLFLKQKDELLEIEYIKLSFNASYQTTSFNRIQGAHHKYSTPGGSSVLHTSFIGEFLGLRVQFDHQQDPEGKRIDTVTFPSGLTINGKEDQSHPNRIFDLRELDRPEMNYRKAAVCFTDGTIIEGILLAFPPELSLPETPTGKHLEINFLFVEKSSLGKMREYFSDINNRSGWPSNADFIASIRRSDVQYVDLLS